MIDTPQEKCNICEETVDDIVDHLRRDHSDQREEIESHYQAPIIQRVFEEPTDTDDDHSPYDPHRECKICGDPLTSEDEEDIETFERYEDALIGHLQSAHDIEEISKRYPKQAEKLSMGTVDRTEEDSTTTQRGSLDSSNESRRTESRGDSSQTVPQDDVGRRGKFSVWGVGGAGNNILDAALMRRDALKGENLYEAWEGGMQTYLPLNTNDQETYGTYYVQVDRDLSRDNADRMCGIGLGTDHGGAGEDPRAAYVWMNSDVEDAPTSTFNRWPFNQEGVNRAQAFLFLHSVVKGTGSGATPSLARYLNEKVIDSDTPYGTPMVSVTVLPKENEIKNNMTRVANCGFGFGWIANEVDLVIPFDNGRLETVAEDIHPQIDRIEEFNSAHATENRPLVGFLEAFMLTSNDKFIDAEATKGISGETKGGGVDDGFDVPDSFRPIGGRYPIDRLKELLSEGDDESDYDTLRNATPAVVGAPVFGRADSRRIDEGVMTTLVSSTLRHGRMVDFDPSTAWGGVFIFYGPKESMRDVARLETQGVLTRIISDVLEDGDADESERQISLHQAVVSDLDKPHIWGLMWNPEMPALQKMYQKAEDLKNGGSLQGMFFREHWDEVERVYQFLGRENMA